MHPFHDGRYSGACTVPRVDGEHKPAAALVVHHEGVSHIAPMFRGLDSTPGIRQVRLAPVTFLDFYPKQSQRRAQ
jgi:hypothetical protein